MSVTRVLVGLLLVAAAAVGGCSAAPASPQTASPQPSSPPRLVAPAKVVPTSSVPGVVAGAYLDFATCDPITAHERTGTPHVYFFSASDCAACLTTDANLTATGVPDGITVYKVDLPSMKELASRYGVTEPHTFVQVDGDLDKVAMWTGSLDGAEIAARMS